MKTFVYDFELQQGASLSKTMTYRTGNPAVPVDLTGATAWMTVRLKNGARTKVLNLTTENGGIALGGPAGTVTVIISRLQSQKFTWGDELANYRLHIQYSTGFVHRLLEGDVTVSPCDD